MYCTRIYNNITSSLFLVDFDQIETNSHCIDSAVLNKRTSFIKLTREATYKSDQGGKNGKINPNKW